jgi:hypothetical protein
MHCCDIARTGQILPSCFPDEWSPTNIVQRDRINSSSKSNENQTFANLNQQLKETFNQTATTENTPANPSAETTEAERKSALATYEEKRLKNYEVCFKFLFVIFLFNKIFIRMEIEN